MIRHYTLCDMDIRIHNTCKTNWKSCACINGFQIFTDNQPDNLSIVSVSLDDLMLYNYTIVLSAGVWTSSTHDWHHSSWVLLTSQRY